MERWFRCFAEIPGIGYQNPPGLRFSYPPHLPLAPQQRTFTTLEGKWIESLMWSTPHGTSSASPASSWRTTPFPGETEAQLTIRQLTEALALPGLARDYHFLLQGSCEVLWRCREREPAGLPALEYFALLDLRLLEHFPEMLLSGVQEPLYLRVETCGRLVSLYEREGYLQDAIAIAERAIRLHQDGMTAQLDRLRKRFALVEAEDE